MGAGKPQNESRLSGEIPHNWDQNEGCWIWKGDGIIPHQFTKIEYLIDRLLISHYIPIAVGYMINALRKTATGLS